MADKLLRIAGRGDDGTAKPIKTDNKGNVGIVLESSHHEISTHDGNNPQSGTTAEFYEIRDTKWKTAYFNHSIGDIFEQAFIINNTLDVDLNISILTAFNENDTLKNGYTVYSGVIPKSKRFHFFSDTSSNAQSIVPLVDLRLPHQYFMIQIKADTVPTTGQVLITNIRRY